jgi:peptide deformylase
MSILPVRLYIDPILHRPCQSIEDFTGLENIAGNMIQTMMEYRGIGLAANQIGLPLNLVALYLEDKTKILVVANIIIKGYTKETDIQNEGCLSCPGVSIPMKRSLGVDVECQLLNGEKVEYRFTDYDARILQHEADHLAGILITQGLIKL